MCRTRLSRRFCASRARRRSLTIFVFAIRFEITVVVHLVVADVLRTERAHFARKSFVDARIPRPTIRIHQASVETNSVHTGQTDVRAYAVARAIVRIDVAPFRAVTIGKTLFIDQTHRVVGIGHAFPIGETLFPDGSRSGHAFERALTRRGVVAIEVSIGIIVEKVAAPLFGFRNINEYVKPTGCPVGSVDDDVIRLSRNDIRMENLGAEIPGPDVVYTEQLGRIVGARRSQRDAQVRARPGIDLNGDRTRQWRIDTKNGFRTGDRRTRSGDGIGTAGRIPIARCRDE